MIAVGPQRRWQYTAATKKVKGLTQEISCSDFTRCLGDSTF
jgi:hypothetical protein